MSQDVEAGWDELRSQLQAEEDANHERDLQIAKALERLQNEWLDKWPNACPHCGGWGGFTYRQSHPYGSTTASEEMMDVCSAPEKAETCHRCGEDGLDEEGNGPCKHCGWNFDDGVPS